MIPDSVAGSFSSCIVEVACAMSLPNVPIQNRQNATTPELERIKYGGGFAVYHKHVVDAVTLPARFAKNLGSCGPSLLCGKVTGMSSPGPFIHHSPLNGRVIVLSTFSARGVGFQLIYVGIIFLHILHLPAGAEEIYVTRRRPPKNATSIPILTSKSLHADPLKLI